METVIREAIKDFGVLKMRVQGYHLAEFIFERLVKNGWALQSYQ